MEIRRVARTRKRRAQARPTRRGDEEGEITEVAYRLEPWGSGTRFTFDHTGFTGIGGFVMAQLLGRVRRKMLRVGFPAVLAEIDDEGRLRAGSSLVVELLSRSGS
jgi:hypothetical protein